MGNSLPSEHLNVFKFLYKVILQLSGKTASPANCHFGMCVHMKCVSVCVHRCACVCWGYAVHRN